MANQLDVAIRQARLFEEVVAGRERLRALSTRLIRAQEDERRHIARELHDEVGQSLTVVNMALQTAFRSMGSDVAVSRITDAVGLVERTLRQLRSISLDLRSSLLDDLGLVSAMRSHVNALSQRTGIAATLSADPAVGRVHPDVETTCYRVLQEALTNVVRHSGATQVWATLSRAERVLSLKVTDTGRGFDPSTALSSAMAGGSLGPISMHERVTLVGGRFTIESTPGLGTTLHAGFPIE